MLAAARKLAGQRDAAPSAVLDQSNSRTRRAISPSPGAPAVCSAGIAPPAPRQAGSGLETTSAGPSLLSRGPVRLFLIEPCLPAGRSMPNAIDPVSPVLRAGSVEPNARLSHRKGVSAIDLPAAWPPGDRADGYGVVGAEGAAGGPGLGGGVGEPIRVRRRVGGWRGPRPRQQRQASTVQAAEAVMRSWLSVRPVTPARPRGGRASASTRRTAALLVRLGEIPCRPCPSVGLGMDWRLEGAELVGQTLVVEQACVHASAFPAVAQADPLADPRILPPSRRRRRQHPGSDRGA